METATYFKWVAGIAGVRPEEGRRTFLATLFYFFFIAHVVMVKSAANSLFLSRHDPKTLPYLYISLAVVVALVSVFASRTLADPRRRTLRLFSLGLVATGLVACWALLRFEIIPISPFLYLFVETAVTTLNIQFWSVAGDIFDPQEGKRVFGIIAGGGMSGSIFGGLFVHHVGPLLGTISLLLTAAGTLVACVFCAISLSRHQRLADFSRKNELPSLRESVRYVLTDSYPRLFGILLLLGSVLTVFVDYFFRTSARAQFGEDQLTVLFGDLNLYVGILSAVFLFLFSGRLLRRLGIFNFLLIIPIGMTLSCGVLLVLPVLLFQAVYALKIIENSGSLSINQAAWQLLYNPVPKILRTPVRGVIDGFFRKLGYAVGGLLLLFFGSWMTHPYIESATLLLLVVFVVLLFLLRGHYIHSLDEKIRVGARVPADLRLEDGFTRHILRQALESPDENLVLTSLRLLSKIPTVDVRKPLLRLLTSSSERIRLASLEVVGAHGYKEFLFDLLGIINSGTRRTRVAAIRAIVSLDPKRASGALSPYLHAEDPGQVAAAIEALIQVRGESPENPAIPILEGWLHLGNRASQPVRREAARLLGRLRKSIYADRLGVYLSDPVPSVRRIAAQSAEKIFRPEFVPLLLEMLSDRETRREARMALASYGDGVIGVLESWLNDRNRPINVRLRLPRLIRMIGTQRAGEVLLFSNIQDDAFLRHRIALALSGIRIQHPEIHFDRSWALEAVDRRLDSYRYYAGVYERIARVLPASFLAIRVLRNRLEQNIEVAFRVLGLVHPHRTIMSIHQRFRDATREKRSDALELLDNLIDRDIRSGLFPILENHAALLSIAPTEQWKNDLPQIQILLEELSESKDLLLRAAAINARCQFGEECSQLYPELSKGASTVNIMEKVLFLETVDIFKKNNLDDLTALAAIAKEKNFSSQQPILEEGEPGDALYIITKGNVDIVKNQRPLLTLGEKESLGGVSFLDQKPHAASAIATTDCNTLVIDRTDFMDLVADRVELLHGIFLALTDRLRALLAVTDGGGLAERNKEGQTNPI
jgi:HEAT repeat protein/ATP/ADP translocase